MIAAEVYLWGTRVGYIVQNNITDIPKFSYDKDFISLGAEISPVVMPLSERIYSFPSLNNETFHYLPGLLADSLPDNFGTKLIETYLQSQGRTLESISSVERLLYTGSRGMGALEYKPALDYTRTDDKSIDINSLIQLASDILNERENIHIDKNKDAMEQIIKIGTSAGGARAKAIIAWNKETGDIRSGQIQAGSGYEYWILKFDGTETSKIPFTKIEYAYYLMAIDAGINMSECRLWENSGKYHFMTKRFDRTDDKGQKIHMQSLGALTHFDYKMPGIHSYEETANIMYKLKLNQDEIEQLFRRMVFNVMARNQDDHVKNISFLMDRNGKWKLSPAYDMTYAYDASNYWLSKHQMSINGKTDNLDKNDVISCGKNMNITENRINHIINEVQGAVQHWAEYAENAQVSEDIIDEIKNNFVLL